MNKSISLVLPDPRLLFLVALTGLVFAAYSSTYVEIFELWQRSSHRHGVVVYPICAWLIWRKLPEIKSIPIQIEPIAFLLAIALVVFWSIGYLTGIQALAHISVIALVPVTILAIAGRRIARQLAFPLLFLFFAVPVSDSFVPVLMAWTADISSFLLRLTGIPVLRSGQYISLPGGEFVVAEVCSGVRYLMTGMIISLLYAHLNFRRGRTIILFSIVSLVTLVLANGARAFIVMYVASSTNMEYLGGKDHVYFGWAFFGITVFLLLWLAGRLSVEQASATSEAESGGQPVSVARSDGVSSPALAIGLAILLLVVTFRPFGSVLAAVIQVLVAAIAVFFAVLQARKSAAKHPESEPHRLGDQGASMLVALLVLTGILFSGPASASLLQRNADPSLTVPDFENIPGCDVSGTWNLDWMPKMQNADTEEAVSMDCSGSPVHVYVAGFFGNKRSSELVTGGNRPVPERWLQTEIGHAESGRAFIESFDADNSSATIVWFNYNVDGELATNATTVKRLQLFSLLTGRPYGGHIVLAAATATESVDSRELLGRFFDAVANAPLTVIQPE